MNKILLVEDDIALSDMLKGYLENDGFEVKTAYDGQEAIDMFNYEKFDLLLLDLMIPKIDGMTVLKTIREKIEDDPSNPIYIKTLWGIGYKMEDV